MNAHTRRESIKIFNMKEDEAALDISTESLVRDMFQDKMKIPEEDVGSIRFKSLSKPRPLIAKFSFYQLRQRVCVVFR